jgi:hypothetical protein
MKRSIQLHYVALFVFLLSLTAACYKRSAPRANSDIQNQLQKLASNRPFEPQKAVDRKRPVKHVRTVRADGMVFASDGVS